MEPRYILRDLREKNGLTQEALASRLMVTIDALGDGLTPALDVVEPGLNAGEADRKSVV